MLRNGGVQVYRPDSQAMKRVRGFILPGAVLLGLIPGAGCRESVSSRAPAVPTAIVLISIDTLRADYLNAYGYSEFETSPFLDAFARENVLFENAFVSEPWTLSSHMSLFTGLYPHGHKVREETRLPKGVPTLALLLQQQGYRTQAFVDGGYLGATWGFDRGFDSYVTQEWRGFEGLRPQLTDWLRRHARERFFLFVHTYDVHSRGRLPYYVSPAPFRGSFSKPIESNLNSDEVRFAVRFRQTRKKLAEAEKRFVRATYAEGVRYVDREIERLVAQLKQLGLYESALVVIWSDHGEGLYDHEAWSHEELFDHTIRVPLLMRIPGFEPGGARIRSVVRSIDILPTILDLVGAEVPAGLDGKSIRGALDGSPDERSAFSWNGRGERRYSVRSQRYRTIYREGSGETLFFDVVRDPGQTRNLHGTGTAAEREHWLQLRAWIEAIESAEPPHPRDAVSLDPGTAAELRALGYLPDEAVDPDH